jgi:hypothetical protein
MYETRAQKSLESKGNKWFKSSKISKERWPKDEIADSIETSKDIVKSKD